MGECKNCLHLESELNSTYAAYGRMAQLNEKLQIEINNLYEEKKRAYDLHDVVAERDELRSKLNEVESKERHHPPGDLL